jgi:hypothetical protein
MHKSSPFWSALFVATLLPGCHDAPAPGRDLRPTPEVETESPSARIFPAPLQGKASFEREGSVGPGAAPAKLPIVGPLEPEARTESQQVGLVLEGHFGWPGVRAAVAVGDKSVATWPALRIQLLEGSEPQPGRVSITFASAAFGLPEDTELRASANAEGWIVVWPDRRSYRVLSTVTLRSLMEERRVDRMPGVPITVTSLGSGALLGRPTTKLRFAGNAGTLDLELAVVPEAGASARLVCGFFLSLVRAETHPSCAPGLVPVAAHYSWGQERGLDFVVTRLAPRGDLKHEDFAIPPALAIYKPGELPPSSSLLWDRAMLEAILPRSIDGEMLTVTNHHDRPLFLLIDGLPVAWLAAGNVAFVPVPAGERRHSARDFFGQVLEAGGIVTAPAQVSYGTPPEPPTE